MCQYSICSPQHWKLAQMAGHISYWCWLSEWQKKAHHRYAQSTCPPYCLSVNHAYLAITGQDKQCKMTWRPESDQTAWEGALRHHGAEDVWVPTGDLYALNFIEYFSQKTGLPNFQQSWCCNQIPQMELWLKLNQLQVKLYCMDNGGEFIFWSFEWYLHGSWSQTLSDCPLHICTQWKAERNHCTLSQPSTSHYGRLKIPNPHCGGMCTDGRYLKDHTPICTLKDKTPYEALLWQEARPVSPCELGCKAFILIPVQWLAKRSTTDPLNTHWSATLQTPKPFRCWNK